MTQTDIPRLDARALAARDPDTLARLKEAATGVGFFTVHDTAIPAPLVARVLEAYRAFFALPASQKAAVDMARTGSNRGWGAPGSEQVDPAANPDYKQVFDVGYTLPPEDPLAKLSVYGPNQWPSEPEGFHEAVAAYYARALGTAMDILRAVSAAIGRSPDAFDDAFDKPMALLRGNYYPPRPADAGPRDFGIATHTDYGCLTLLATDGTPGLEVRTRGGGWLPVTAPVGEFVINFGEMLQIWTGGEIKATPHRVKGTDAERLSIPLFFNPTYDTNVAPPGAAPVLAGDHLAKRFAETYVHLKAG
ncbi:isopenicillin N synthase family dioxygenase [Pseudaestuariivita atlantica]|uniref:2-oxoglutarate-dependent ethylene/succinate-forming enzyme n=1 Tax=Pseudaestuariivita atlantica TaxID=1317121 RepID=A0A0L1JL69_9RHOB|nr:2-oxoglutarate and iron-dependent oxygenase domain-containing protein [Pseudaestuariivita atlantica]KNG92457.1 oxidoreductase [Pseudaestuariivita atlantica]